MDHCYHCNVLITAANRSADWVICKACWQKLQQDAADARDVLSPELHAIEQVPLLRADPHRWGAGLVHLIDQDKDQTLCGKSPGGCPGTKFWGRRDKITCKSCLRSIAARVQAEERRREWEQRERELAQNNRLWWLAYSKYLLTQTWRDKRAMVMRRAAGRCEGCGRKRAVEVHHREYPRDCRPGSAQWVAREKLFTLVALCSECHYDLHHR